MNKRPKNTKYNKYHKGRITHNLPIIVKNINQENQPNIFRYKLISLESCRLTASQIGAAELAIKRKIKSIQLPTFSNTITEDTTQSFSSSSSSSFSQQFLTLIFPQIPVTKKPAEVRMGKGKGNIDY